MALRKVRLAIVFVGVLGLAGCRSSGPIVFNSWFRERDPYVPGVGRSNAFDGYLRAAALAKADDPQGILRVHFTQGQEESSLKKLSGALAEFGRAVRQPCTFEFRASMPFVENPNHAGWRHIARALVWRLDRAVETQSTGQIETLTAQTSKFGMDLMQGAAPEADLGLSLLDESRQVLAPNLDRMSPGLLNSLAEILESTTGKENWLDTAIEHEHESMLAGVQFVQNAYVSQDYKLLQEQLGNEVREAIEYFKQLRGQGADRQMAYFAGFAKEADTETSWVRTQASLPVQKRVPLEFPEGTSRPWRRFSKHFFRTLRPLLEKQVRTEARTRLMILECRILAQIKTSGSAPKDLSAFPITLTTDPFTGRPFSYEADGPAFKLYSPGPDFIDNGGKTGDEFETPDFTIERGL